MCDYDDDKTLSKDTNAILKRLQCMETRRQLGHCLVYDAEGRCNVPGMPPKPTKSNR